MKTLVLSITLILCSCRLAPLQASEDQESKNFGKAPCTVIDTDLGLDDYRAIALVLDSRTNVHFVISEGVSEISYSRIILKALLEDAGDGKEAYVLVGRSVPKNELTDIPRLEHQQWIASVREHFRTLAQDPHLKLHADAFEGKEFEAKTDDDTGHTQVENEFAARLATECSSIEILLLGPATNFVRYAPLLGARLTRVVSEMALEKGTPRADAFNCFYDWPSCVRLGFLSIRPKIEFADVPYKSSFVPTHDLVLRFDLSALGSDLVRLHQTETSWCDGSTSFGTMPQQCTS